MTEHSRKSWDPIWEEVFSQSAWGKYPGESLIQFIARNFYKLNRPEIKILEVGCGPGANIWYLARERFSAYGMDGSPTAIDQTRKRLLEEGLVAELVVGDIVNLPYSGSFFDAVIDLECLYSNSAENAQKILGEIDRVLKTGGLFYSRTLSEKMYLGKTRAQLDDKAYTDVSDGPLSGRGFVRLMDLHDIHSLYGKIFNIRSIDLLEYTRNNQSETVTEYVIISEKK